MTHQSAKDGGRIGAEREGWLCLSIPDGSSVDLTTKRGLPLGRIEVESVHGGRVKVSLRLVPEVRVTRVPKRKASA